MRWRRVLWDFGDGSTRTVEISTYKFAKQGFYILKLLPVYSDGMKLHKIAFVEVK
ncbi:MAG: hypothetical protein QW620_06010 [Thermoplasmata archaeon]